MSEARGAHLRLGCTSDQGKVRGENQDACFADLELGLLIVADGMGGHNAGAVAAQAIVELLPGLLRERAPFGGPEERERALSEAIFELSGRVRQLGLEHPEMAGLGATVVAVLIQAGEAFVANLGDSRAYLLRGDRLQQLTEDHSIVAILLEEGAITEEEARVHPARGALTSFVGMEHRSPPSLRRVALEPGDRLLLCTDGLTGDVPEEVICQTLRSNPVAREACSALVAVANEAGGVDNITALVADWLG